MNLDGYIKTYFIYVALTVRYIILHRKILTYSELSDYEYKGNKRKTFIRGPILYQNCWSCASFYLRRVMRLELDSASDCLTPIRRLSRSACCSFISLISASAVII